MKLSKENRKEKDINYSITEITEILNDYENVLHDIENIIDDFLLGKSSKLVRVNINVLAKELRFSYFQLKSRFNEPLLWKPKEIESLLALVTKHKV